MVTNLFVSYEWFEPTLKFSMILYRGISKQNGNFIKWFFVDILKINISHVTKTFISLKVAYNSNEGIDTLFNKIGLHMGHTSMLKIIKRRSHSNTAV